MTLAAEWIDLWIEEALELNGVKDAAIEPRLGDQGGPSSPSGTMRIRRVRRSNSPPGTSGRPTLRLEPIIAVAATLRRRRANHLAYFRRRIIECDGGGEEISIKIQMIKLMACGYRNRDRYKTAIHLYCDGLKLFPRVRRQVEPLVLCGQPLRVGTTHT